MHPKLYDAIFNSSSAQAHDNRLKIAALSIIASGPWTGRTGITDHRVLEEHLSIGHACAQLVFTASSRQIATNIGYLRGTVENSRERLSEDSWLTVLERGRGRRASTIELRLDRLQNIPLQDRHSLYSYISDNCNGTFSGLIVRSADPDAFRAGALQRSALDVLAHLSGSPAKPSSLSDLEQSTGRGRSTIYRASGALVSAGLAFPVDGGWYRIDAPIEALHEKQAALARGVFGTDGFTARQAERYEDERSVYRRYCDQFARGTRGFFLGEDERFAARPEKDQQFATDLAMRAAEHVADLGILPFSMADLRRRAFRLVITASDPPDGEFEDLAKYLVR